MNGHFVINYKNNNKNPPGVFAGRVFVDVEDF
jgi:hypothetical protein